MKCKVIQIYWHEKKPIYSLNFNPIYQNVLATCGGDYMLRLWKISSAKTTNNNIKVIVEFVTQLEKHCAPINCCRFSPNGEFLASAGDDSCIIIWKRTLVDNSSKSARNEIHSETNETKTYNKNEPNNNHNEVSDYKWIALKILRTYSDVYDLAWDPYNSYIGCASLDGSYSIFSAKEGILESNIKKIGKCTYTANSHTNYVQGINWDPLNNIIITQSCDRSIKIHKLVKTIRSKKLYANCIATSQKIKITPNKSFDSNIEEHNKEKIPNNSNNKEPEKTELCIPSIKQNEIINNDNAILVSDQHYLYISDKLNTFYRRSNFSPDGSLIVIPAGKSYDSKERMNMYAAYIYTRNDLVAPKIKQNTTSKNKQESENETINTNIYPVLKIDGFDKPTVITKFSPIIYKLKITNDNINARNKSEIQSISNTCSEDQNNTQNTGMVFQLAYRMIYAIATQDCVYFYDTLNTNPIGIVSDIHYASITDISWSGDGTMLFVSSLDGFCSVIWFEENELGEPLDNLVEALKSNTRNSSSSDVSTFITSTENKSSGTDLSVKINPGDKLQSISNKCINKRVIEAETTMLCISENDKFIELKTETDSLQKQKRKRIKPTLLS